ncbi:MAG TPA: MlaD family protein [Bryobacteraceae bacterium]|nr:MlaD family protein [Bryobacteraceae bacterium]
MPSSAKAKWSQLRVGLLAMGAMAILGFLIFLMTSNKGFFRSDSDIYTYMDDSAAIVEGAPVRLNGILIGQITKVALSGEADPHRAVRLTLRVEDNYFPSIPVDSTAKLAAENLLGTKYINITRGQSKEILKPGAEVPSANTPELEDLFQQGYSALGSLDSIVKKLNTLLDQIQEGKGTIGQLLVDDTIARKATVVLDDVHKMADALNVAMASPDNSVGKLLHDNSDLYNDFRGSLMRVDTLLDGLNKGEGTAGKLLHDPAVYDEFHNTITDVRNLLAGLNRGEGDAGKFLKSEEIHQELQSSLARLDTLLDKINNGQGVVSQLLNNPALYEDLDGTTRELQGLLKDFRSNPKKFLRIKLGLF